MEFYIVVLIVVGVFGGIALFGYLAKSNRLSFLNSTIKNAASGETKLKQAFSSQLDKRLEIDEELRSEFPDDHQSVTADERETLVQLTLAQRRNYYAELHVALLRRGKTVESKAPSERASATDEFAGVMPELRGLLTRVTTREQLHSLHQEFILRFRRKYGNQPKILEGVLTMLDREFMQYEMKLDT
ncbi:MAG: hypothetical protein IPH75_08105 [bacterium]|nr:hypothetical protein [bacterium]